MLSRSRHPATWCPLFVALSAGCHSEEDIVWVDPPGALQPGAAPTAASPDRLPPGELLEGSDTAFGFVIPKGMTLQNNGQKGARVEGDVNFDLLIGYVKDRLLARHAEMVGDRILFHNVQIRGGDKNQVFDFTLIRYPKKAVLLIKNQTRLPGTRGLSEEDRWKRAGFKRGGGVIDRNALE